MTPRGEVSIQNFKIILDKQLINYNKMYNEQLEQLIDAALADGVLTEKEKQILFRKAQSMGIDLDEFEMVLDARLFNLQKVQKQQTLASSAPKSDKYGDVKKCPACGALIESFTTRCPECGHEFSNIAANSSIQKLFEMLNQAESETSINQKNRPRKLGFLRDLLLGEDDEDDEDNEERILNKKKTIIQNFPIPNTKDDILEFLSLAVPLARTPKFFSQDFDYIQDEMRPIWKAKCEQIIMKARFSMRDDKKSYDIIKEYANELKIRM